MAPEEDESMNKNYERFYAVIKKIPKGKVATYGQIARLAGLPRHARHVGFALAELDEGAKLPWQRVVNAGGRVSRREHPNSERLQRALLEREKVEFGPSGRIELARFAWRPPRR